MYHPPNPSIHHPNHLWFICTNQNGLQYPPESTTFHPIPPLHLNQDLLHSKTTCLKMPPTTAHTHMHHPPYNNQLDRFYVLQGIVCSGKCIRILLFVDCASHSSPNTMYNLCYHLFYRYAQPNHAPTIKWRIRKWFYLWICCNKVRANVLASVRQLERSKYNSRGLTQCCNV